VRLIDLLNTIEIFTTIYLYESSSSVWTAKNETLISNKETVQELAKSKYKDYKVIGITTKANALRITVYKGTKEWKRK